MLFFYNASGTLIKVVPDHVYQGSDGATTLYFVAPISSEAAIDVAFSLPNGERSAKHPLTPQGGEELNGIVDEYGNEYSIWTYDLAGYETAYAGEETAQFFITLNGFVRATQAATFTVELGVPPVDLPTQGDSYTELRTLIQEIIQNKQDTLVSGENIKTINHQSVLGSGNLEISGLEELTEAQRAALDSGIDSTKVAKIGTNESAISVINDKIPSAASAQNQLVDETGMQAFALPITTKYGASLSLAFNSANGQLTAQLKDQDGNNLGTAQTVTIDLTSLENTINNILALIPSQASAQNQLADKAFVNSSISTNTAHFIGTFNSVAELEAYTGTVTNNDYANVIRTVDGQTYYDRYTYNGNTEEWEFNFTVNTTSFTAAQWAALNSGITASIVAKIVTLDGNQTITGIKTFDGSNDKRPIAVISGDNGDDLFILANGVLVRLLSGKATANLGALGLQLYRFKNDTAFDANNHYKGVRLIMETPPADGYTDTNEVLYLPLKSGTLATLDDITAALVFCNTTTDIDYIMGD